MIYFIYGEDFYRAKEKLKEIIEQYKTKHKSGLNLIQINAKEKSFENLLDSFKIASMFDEKKLIIIKDVFLNKKFEEDFLKEIKILKDSKDVIVVFSAQGGPASGGEKVDQRNKLFKALIKFAKCQEFNFLDNRGLKIWFNKELVKYKLKIEPLAEAMLLSYVGNDLWQLKNEIKKLADFKQSGIIKKEDVALHVRPKIESDIFKTIDSLSLKDKKQAMNLLYKHIENGDNPLYLLSMIGYQFRNLLIIKELQEAKKTYETIVKKSGLHPFVVKKSYYLCNQFTFLQLKKIYRKIFQIDLEIKTGKIDAETALDLLVAEI